MDLRQSTSGQTITIGQALDSLDGNTEENALTIANTDIKINKHNGTTLINKTLGGATNISNGVYYLTLDATDTDTAGRLLIYVHVAGALVMKVDFNVLTQSAYDAKYTGTFNNVAATEIVSAGAITTLAGAVVNVDLVDTLTTYTSNTPQSADNATNITTILADTNELQTNQNNWLTATGFNTVVPASLAEFNARTILSADYSTAVNLATVDSNVNSILTDTNELQLNQGGWLTATGFSTFNPAVDAVANVTLVATTTTNTDMVAEAPTTLQIWAETTRVLTSGVNIALAKGVGLTGLNDIASTDIVTNGAINTSSGNASVDVVKFNGIVVVGTGTAGDLWRA